MRPIKTFYSDNQEYKADVYLDENPENPIEDFGDNFKFISDYHKVATLTDYLKLDAEIQEAKKKKKKITNLLLELEKYESYDFESYYIYGLVKRNYEYIFHTNQLSFDAFILIHIDTPVAIAQNTAKSFLERYNSYINNEIYGYMVSEKKSYYLIDENELLNLNNTQLSDSIINEKFKKEIRWEEQDSLWGIYGFDETIEHLKQLPISFQFD